MNLKKELNNFHFLLTKWLDKAWSWENLWPIKWQMRLIMSDDQALFWPLENNGFEQDLVKCFPIEIWMTYMNFYVEVQEIIKNITHQSLHVVLENTKRKGKRPACWVFSWRKLNEINLVNCKILVEVYTRVSH